MPAKKKRKTKSKRFSNFLLHPALLMIIGVILSWFFITTLYDRYLRPDERAIRINTYFAENNAPLAGYGYTFIRAADSCGMDWRLLPAITMQESTGGKFMKNKNPFGWGSAEIPFETIDEAILHVGSHLCGNRPETSKWYSTTSTQEKLYYYNGTVAPSYPDEVMWIMDQI